VLIFNCSKAFAEFIEPKKPGPAPLVGAPPSQHPSEDAPFLIDADDQPPRHVQQWLVHFFRIRRKPCVVAMDIGTRYAMVFSHLKKGDPEGFLNAFATRLVNEMAFAAQSAGMMGDFEAMLMQFLERHSRFQFFLRTERSTQAHLKDAVWMFDYWCEDAGRVLETHEECAAVDARTNKTPRNVKGRKDYFFPEWEMLCEWLKAFGGLTAEGEAALRTRLQDMARQKPFPDVPGYDSFNA